MLRHQDVAIERFTERHSELQTDQASAQVSLVEPAPLTVGITPGAALRSMLIFLAFLLLANLAMIVLVFHFQYEDLHGLTRVFTFGDEKNVPTLFSSIGLILCAALLSIIAAAHKRTGTSYLPWAGLAALFLFLSIDETASLHEKLTLPMRELLNTSGFFHFAWVIPYGAALVLLGLLYFRFLKNLPGRTRLLLLASGATYIAGAIGLEMLGGWWVLSYGDSDLPYQLIVTMEELLEMLGIIGFAYTLLRHMSGLHEISVLFTNDQLP